MHNVAIYPFNKITRGLVRFRNRLSFNIEGIVDFTNLVGNDAGYEVSGQSAGIEVISNLEKISKKIDTLILTDSLEDGLIKRREADFFKVNKIEEKWKNMILFAKENNINIISIHPLCFFSESINSWFRENDIEIKLYEIDRHKFISYINKAKENKVDRDIDLVSVFATRGCLGKFTAQMMLRESLLNKNVNVGTIITEPTHFLFNEYNGYYLKLLSEIKENDSEIKDYFGAHIENAKIENKDMVLIAAQGSLCKMGRISDWALTVYGDFFEYSKILLVVDYEDDEEIEIALKALREQANQKPFALLIPDKIENSYGEYEIKSADEIKNRKQELKDKFKINHVELIKDIANIGKILVSNS